MGARINVNYLRPGAFHPHFSMDLALSNIESPKRTGFVLSGVRWAIFEMSIHGQPPDRRLQAGKKNIWTIERQ